MAKGIAQPGLSRVFAASLPGSRSSRRRLANLLIETIAAAHGLDLYTRNPDDCEGLDEVAKVVRV